MRQETTGRLMSELTAMCDASRRPWRLISSGLLSPILMVLIVGVLLTGCRSQKASADPAIEFAKIPPAAQGGRERVDTISGRVVGARPGQQIVIYARSGPWWVQPWPESLIPIQADSTWSTETHLGFEYAALLVEPGYGPAATMDVAPAPGGGVVAVNVVKGTGT